MGQRIKEFIDTGSPSDDFDLATMLLVQIPHDPVRSYRVGDYLLELIERRDGPRNQARLRVVD